MRDILHAFKYAGTRRVAPRLSQLMREQARDLLTDAAFVVPVPLHPSRQRARGFNQAADLAAGLALPVLPALRRTRPTRPQVSLPASQRHRNVRGAFALASAPMGGLVLRPGADAGSGRAPRDLGWFSVVRDWLAVPPGAGPAIPWKTAWNPRHAPRLALTRALIAGRTLVLVDDVATTGATLEACADVLLREGAREVRAVTAAQAVTARPR